MGHVSRRKERSLTRIAARILLVLGIAAGVGAILDFAYSAYRTSLCYETNAGEYSDSIAPRVPVDSNECRLTISRGDVRQRRDAVIAILAIVVGIGAAVRLSSASHRTRRLVLVAEVVAVAVGAIYFALLATMVR